jgi:hypothetical protein
MIAALTSPSPTEVASFLAVLFFLVAGWNQVQRAIDRVRDKTPKREILPQPLDVNVSGKIEPRGRRFSVEACDSRHQSIDHRLDAHDIQIKDIWFTLREEDSATRKALENAVRDFDKTVNRMDGTLQAVKETNTMILKRLLGKDTE